jgi:hypothetical protein
MYDILEPVNFASAISAPDTVVVSTTHTKDAPNRFYF